MEEKGKGCVRSYEYPYGKVEILDRNCGDFIETTYVKGVIFNKPGLVAAVGGIPDELKIDDAISFSVPCAPYKYPKTLPGDPTQRRKVLKDAFEESKDKTLSNFILALIKACGMSSGSISEQSEEKETHSTEEERPAMIEVNLAVSLLVNPILFKQEMEEKEKGKGVKRNFESPRATTQCDSGDSTDERHNVKIEVCKEAMGNIAHKKSRVSSTSICKLQDGDQQARTMVENNLAASLAPSTLNCSGGFQHCYINQANIGFHAAAGGAQGAAEVHGPPHASNLQAAIRIFNRYFRGINHCYNNTANFVFHAGAGGAPSGAVQGPDGGGGSEV